ncbi:hypothetical protein GCM10009680_68980 [Streptomyces yatensis]|uniref:Uncharacterized protein n=1 Tax=Streptomyces yatensis TaxID=155177 RepID=A0ABN2J4J3_9ACTN
MSTNPVEVDDVHHAIGWIFELLMSPVLRTRGGQRRSQPSSADSWSATSVVVDTPKVRLPHVPAPVLRGGEVSQVRPYVTAYERQREGQCRCAQVLATYGFDPCPCRIRGGQATG